MHNNTSSVSQLAPLPFSINARSGLTITADNPYNPFGVDIGAGAPHGEQTQIRLTGLGPRQLRFSSANDQARVGLRGSLFETWQWELFTPLTGSADNYVSPNPDDPAWDSLGGNQIRTFFTGAALGNYAIKPEQGKSFDFAVVYDPQWLSGLSVSADLWRIYLNDLIVRPTGQTVVDFCYADANSPYRDLIVHGGGAIDSIVGLTFQNFGRLDTKGVDVALSYRLPETAFGSFTLGLDTTYIAQYDVRTPGAPAVYNAGQYTTQYGNFTRWRGLGSVAWQMGDFSATWTQRHFGRLSIVNPDFGLPDDTLRIGAVVTHNLAFGYNIEPINTRVDVGIDNVGDKQPPKFYANTTTNANIDINTYDPIGRFYRGRLTVKF